MLRGALLAVLIVAACVLGPVTSGAAGTAKPDVFLKERGDEYYAGQNLYSDEGAGESRSLIIRTRMVVLVKIQNDGDAVGKFLVEGSPAEPGYELHYLIGGTDVTARVTATGTSTRQGVRVQPHGTATLRVILIVDPTAHLGARQELLVRATGTGSSDAARAEITKVTEPS